MSEQRIEYRDAVGNAMVGYLHLPDALAQSLPAVAVVPEAPGSGPMPRRRAEMLAKAGYAAFVVDLYGTGRFTGYTPEANDLAQAMLADPALLLARVDAGIKALSERPEIDPARLAAIGYCLGGKGVLDFARSGKPIKAIIAFHGLLVPYRAGPPENISAKLLLLNGGRDPLIPAADIAAFCAEMSESEADYRVVIYGNAGHAFTSFEVPRGTMPPEMGDFGFDEEADALAWAETEAFLRQHLG